MTKTLKPLVMMQLKDKLDFSFLKSKKQTITKVILSIIAFVAVTAGIYLLLYFGKLLKIFHLADIIPTSVIVVVFTVMELLSLISCTYGIMNTLYFSKDNQVLLTLPATTNQVFLSKIIVYFVYELKKNLYFFVPLFVAYALIAGLPIYFYLWLIVCWVVISALTVSIASLFSIFAMLITMFLKNFGLIRIILFVGIVGFAIWGIVSVINLIPADIDLVGSFGTIFWKIQSFLNDFTQTMYPFTMVTRMIIGGYVGIQPKVFSISTLWILLSVLGVVIVMLALAFLISRPLFFKMAAKPFEYRKVTREFKRKNHKTNSFISAVKAQILLIVRSSDELFSLLGSAIALPILILLLNRIFSAMSTRVLGDHMTVAFNLLIILLISLASNGKVASIYSREGAAAYLNKTRPNEYRNNLIAKLVPNIAVMICSIIASVVVFGKFTTLSEANKVWFALGVIFVYLMHLLWSAEMDIMNPQSSQYATTGDHHNNPNETKSSITMFILSFIFFAVALFLMIENIEIALIKVCLVAFALLAYRVWSYLSKIKYYYKEK